VDRWTPLEANAWWDARTLVSAGFNFLPFQSAVNFLEMLACLIPSTKSHYSVNLGVGCEAWLQTHSASNLHYLRLAPLTGMRLIDRLTG